MDPSTDGALATAGAPGPRLRLEPAERQALAGLAAIYAARMLGLFLLLPVLALYAGGLPNVNSTLVGLAMATYPLMQAFLQVPFGVASDRFGRRPVIAAGLVLYGAGSVIGALTGGIGGLIAARLVQGAGAVSGPVTALLADATRNEVRTRAMAVIGISIGGSFVISLVAAPPLAARIGVPGLFWIMAGLAGLCLLLLYTTVPKSATRLVPRAAGGPGMAAALTAQLLPYHFGVFVLNFVLTAAFVGAPHALRDVLGIAVEDHWKTYLWVFLASLPPTVPFVLYIERSKSPWRVFRLGIALLAASLAALVFAHRDYWAMSVALVGFFAAFNFLEARLPARLSQAAPAEIRGAALSVFAVAQVLGSAAGGFGASKLNGSSFGIAGVFAGAALVALLWLVIARPERASAAAQ